MYDVLKRLEATILSRKGKDENTSYVASLLAKGPAKAAKKLGEEAVELVMASAQHDKKEIVYEAGDTLFHLMVLLAAHNIPFEAVLDELTRREGTSGIEEKATRKP